MSVRLGRISLSCGGGIGDLLGNAAANEVIASQGEPGIIPRALKLSGWAIESVRWTKGISEEVNSGGITWECRELPGRSEGFKVCL